MNRKLTRITPFVNGYAVVIAQEHGFSDKPGAYLGCFLQTPENLNNGTYMLLAEAMDIYLKCINEPRDKPTSELTKTGTFDGVAMH